MAAVVYQTNKKTGITYVYESISHWDKDKRQSRSKRKCIGRVDPGTGEIISTRKKTTTTDAKRKKRGPVPVTWAARRFYGATYLLDRIGEDTGVTEDLKACFPESYRQILSIAYYLILEDKNPLSRFPRWATLHRHPYGEGIPSQRSSEIFASITAESMRRFFLRQGKRRVDREYLAYDSTSISSYSKCLRQVRYGSNKDHEHPAQIHLALLFGQQSRLPFYYRKLAGNIPDVKTLRKLLSDINTLGYEKIKVVLDRGFFSAGNINDLYRHHMKFLIAARLSLKFVTRHLETVRDKMRSWTHYHQAYQLYTFSLPVTWDYVRERPRRGDMTKADRLTYLHLYYSPERALEDEKAFNIWMADLHEELASGRRHPDHERHYAKYFEVRSTPVRGTKIIAKEDVFATAKRNYGYFALVSNEIKDAVEALEIYRNKDIVEKAFDNLKERLNLRRVAVSPEESLDGKLFVQFIALIFLSSITKRMQDSNLFKDYTLQAVLDDLDVIECYDVPGPPRRACFFLFP